MTRTERLAARAQGGESAITKYLDADYDQASFLAKTEKLLADLETLRVLMGVKKKERKIRCKACGK